MLDANVPCEWGQEDEDRSTWTTDCGGAFGINEGTPSYNDMKFCCYCGRTLAEVPYPDNP